jgi:outer membrane receptor for ferrienterochelin and colicins
LTCSLLFGFLALFLAPLPVFTQEKLHDEEGEDDIELDAVTVTGTRTIQEITQTPVQTEIIDEEFIEASGADTVDDVFEAAGLQFAENAMGNWLQVQGMTGERVLVLVDGRRITGRVAGNLVGDTLPLQSIERVEIVRGPQSALYGSEAIGGVINIITKKPSDSVTGSYSIKNNALIPAGEFAPVWQSLVREQSATAELTLPLAFTSNRLQVAAGNAFNYLDDDGVALRPSFKRAKVSLESRIDPSPRLDLTLGGDYSFHRQDEQTSGSGSFDRIDTQRGGGFISGTWFIDGTKDLTGTTHYNFFFRDKEQYNGLLDLWADNGDEREHYVSGDLFFTWYMGEINQLDIGVSYIFNQLEKYNILNYETIRRHTFALVLQDQLSVGPVFDLVGGLRTEYSNDYGWFAAPKLSAALTILDNLRVFPSVGVGYRAPSFLELYLDSAHTSYQKYGNPDLLPEKSLGFNLGVDWFLNPGLLQLNLFHNELWDEIAYDYTDQYEGDRQVIIKQNLNRSTRTGADLSVGFSFFKGVFAPKLRYSFLYSFDRQAGERLDDQPTHSGGLRLTFTVPGIDIVTFVEGDIKGPFDRRETVLFVLNWYAEVPVFSFLTVYGGVDNITGASDDYTDTLIGPVFFAGVKGSF